MKGIRLGVFCRGLALAVLLTVSSNGCGQIVAEQAVTLPEGINDSFVDPELKIEEWVQRFEVESREVFAAREKVVAAVGLQPGKCVADVGAGTGLFTRLFSPIVGKCGWVYAVDISPRFVEHIAAQAREAGLSNVTVVLCTHDSITLPANSIDVAFVCDTYHHFEYPQSTLGSIHRALRCGGALLVVDFERVPGVSREWILDHVRADKETVIGEIEQAGFVLDREIPIDGFVENYCLRFCKK
jgi:predicted methyltransferase